MDKRTRVLNAMNKKGVDHVPVGFWFHFSGEEASGEACVQAHLKYYRETIPHTNESDLRMSVSMLLLNYGPKVDESLADDEVEIFNGFIC